MSGSGRIGELSRRIHTRFASPIDLAEALFDFMDTANSHYGEVSESCMAQQGDFVRFIAALWTDPRRLQLNHLDWLHPVLDLLDSADQLGNAGRSTVRRPGHSRYAQRITTRPVTRPHNSGTGDPSRPQSYDELISLVRSEPAQTSEYALPILRLIHRLRGQHFAFELVAENPVAFLQAIRDEVNGVEPAGTGSEVLRGSLRDAAHQQGFHSLDEVAFASDEYIQLGRDSGRPSEHGRPQDEPLRALPRDPPAPLVPNGEEEDADAIEERYFPNISHWLTTRQGPKPKVTCLMCTEELVIDGLQPRDENREEPFVLDCLHVFGKECLAGLVDAVPALDRQAPRCPVCRDDISDSVAAAIKR